MKLVSACLLGVKCRYDGKSKPNKKIISIDPGVRTFLTGYTNDKHVLEIGTNVYKKIERCHKKIKKINDPKKSEKTERKTKLMAIELIENTEARMLEVEASGVSPAP